MCLSFFFFLKFFCSTHTTVERTCQVVSLWKLGRGDLFNLACRWSDKAPGRRPALRSHEAGDWCCLADNLPLDEELQVERGRKRRAAQSGDQTFSCGSRPKPPSTTAAPGWNQFYLYQRPSSVSRNPHVAEQPGEKLMCSPIMKWCTAKNKFKKVACLSPTAVQRC